MNRQKVTNWSEVRNGRRMWRKMRRVRNDCECGKLIDWIVKEGCFGVESREHWAAIIDPKNAKKTLGQVRPGGR